MYIFFSETEFWKSNDLEGLKDFVSRNFEIEVSWMKLRVGEKLVFSECGDMSLERCPSHYKCLHQIPTIGELKRLIHYQN